MAFRTNPAPYQRAKNSTLKIMITLAIALAIVWICGIVYSFILDGKLAPLIADFNEKAKAFNQANAADIESGTKEAMNLLSPLSLGLRSILMMVVAAATTAVCDVLTTLARHKKDSKLSIGREIGRDLVHNYSYITSMIFVLTLPVYVNFYVVIIGAVFATVVCKNFFGGFGKNIFNPAIMARIFVGLSLGGFFVVPDAISLTGAGINAVGGATLTTAFNNSTHWLATTTMDGTNVVTSSIFTNYSIMDLLLGNYLGALGETFTLVILVLCVVLSALKVINWRTPVFYLGTVALTSLVIALVLGFKNPLNYVVYQLALGGLAFGAVFMLTDPVTGPTSNFGKTLIAVIAGLLTMLIRVKGGYPEGVMFSIALCNLISPLVDALVTGKTTSKLGVKYASVFGLVAITIGLMTGLSWKVNGGKEVYDVNGMSIGDYNLLTSYIKVKDGDTLKKVENYEVKTSEIKKSVGTAADIGGDVFTQASIVKYTLTETSLNANGEIEKKEIVTFDAVYDIMNSSKEKIARMYTMSTFGGIIEEDGEYSDRVSCVLFIAINNDGSIYGIHVLNQLTTNKYGLTEAMISSAENDYVGKTESNYNDVEKVTGATYSTNNLKYYISLAYEEFKLGGQ